ncbi:MAG: ribonuclease HI [Oligoflexia bacterium]|nr:ribonuclease HI [Oligoflexia bacterium]MBF0364579.1 ribonuclease HI [Oligoflexia bacterium]
MKKGLLRNHFKEQEATIKNSPLDLILELEKLLASDPIALSILGDLREQVVPSKQRLAKQQVVEKRGFELPEEFVQEKNASFVLFSDGACKENPGGVGAWAFVGQNRQGEVFLEKSGVANNTTNNRMELTGVIRALEHLYQYLEENSQAAAKSKEVIFLFTDSRYVVDGFSKWMAGWKRRGWKKPDNREPENLELWQRLDRLHHEVFSKLKILWVRGHVGHPQNEYCDQLCTERLKA